MRCFLWGFGAHFDWAVGLRVVNIYHCYGRAPCDSGYRAGSLHLDEKWSSVRAHLAGKDDGLVCVKRVLDRVDDFSELLQGDESEAYAAFRRAEYTGRPLGTEDFIDGLERILGRRIARRAPGRKRRGDVVEQKEQMCLDI